MRNDLRRHYLDLARLQQECLSNRQKYEFQISLATFGGIAGFTVFVFEYFGANADSIAGRVFLIYAGFFFAWCRYWWWPLYCADLTDKRFRDFYRDLSDSSHKHLERPAPAARAMSRDNSKDEATFCHAFWNDLWFSGQPVMLFLFLCLSFALIINSSSSEKQVKPQLLQDVQVEVDELRVNRLMTVPAESVVE